MWKRCMWTWKLLSHIENACRKPLYKILTSKIVKSRFANNGWYWYIQFNVMICDNCKLSDNSLVHIWPVQITDYVRFTLCQYLVSSVGVTESVDSLTIRDNLVGMLCKIKHDYFRLSIRKRPMEIVYLFSNPYSGHQHIYENKWT